MLILVKIYKIYIHIDKGRKSAMFFSAKYESDKEIVCYSDRAGNRIFPSLCTVAAIKRLPVYQRSADYIFLVLYNH